MHVRRFPSAHSLPVWVVAMLTALACLAAPAGAVTDEQVGKAIDVIKKKLLSMQAEDGSFEPEKEFHGKNQGGQTALVTLALMVSGEPMQNPKIAQAIRYLKKVKMEGTYAVGIRAHVWANLPEKYYQEALQTDAAWLLDTHKMHKRGTFDYTQGYSGRLDHSVTQYGMLGLWEAGKRGVKVPDSFWNAMKKHFIEQQFPSGGWGYDEKPESERESMTLAGLTALYVAQQELHRRDKRQNKEIKDAIDRGLDWMDKRFNTGDGWYALYGLERVALASGVRYFNKKDWFETGAAAAVRSNGEIGGGHGGPAVASSFALMFLSRGRVPVWINKLEVPGQAWNNHPNDLYFLTNYISNSREGEVNWQTTSIDFRPDSWLLAPVAFLSSHEKLQLTDQQLANLKQYLDRGGLLVCNPDDNSSAFKAGIKEIAEKLYPQYELRAFDDNHPLFSSLTKIEDGKKQKIMGVSNGAREMIILFDRDYGYSWQAEAKQEGPVFDLAANLFALATNRGILNNRLVPPFEDRAKRNVAGEYTIARAKYEGNWLPEPAAWALLGNPMFNATGINLKTEDVDLAKLGDAPQRFVHLAGTTPHKLTDDERAGIKKFVEKGGTVFVETVGGQDQFSADIEKQLAGVFQNPPVPLSAADPLISGEGLGQGAFDCSRVRWRWRTVQTMAVLPKPRLAAITVGSRPAVIFSHEDISLGLVGVRHWHVMGYEPFSARRLATNILLAAHK